MKHYNTKLTLQNLGSGLLVILRGKKEDIEESFNSFYNLCGANGKLEISEFASSAIGLFWTDKELLCRYWQNRFINANRDCNDSKVYSGKNIKANAFVQENISLMRESAEAFMSFHNKHTPVEHGIGKVSAENPNLSFSEAAHAHISKNQE